MTDLIAIALIAGGPGYVAACLNVWNTLIQRRNTQHIEQLKVNTDGMTTKLAAITGEKKFAEGLALGREGTTGPPGPTGERGEKGDRG